MKCYTGQQKRFQITTKLVQKQLSSFTADTVVAVADVVPDADTVVAGDSAGIVVAVADVVPDADRVVAGDSAGLNQVVAVVVASFVPICCSPADVAIIIIIMC